jgi:hypothetical protein
MSLMSEQSKQALAGAFFRAAKASLVRAPDHAIDIAPLEGVNDVQAGQTVLVITTSSFTFRLLTLFHFPATPESRAYYGSGPADPRFDAVLSEVVNLCCGTLNRELSHHFPHLGMSIPYSLGRSCLTTLGDLKPEYLARYAITVNNSVRVEATLCMCCSANVEVSAGVEVAEEKTGELELF